MSVLGNLSEPVKHWLDVGTVTGFVIAGISLANMAVLITILSGLLSVSLAAMRWHDRIRYGPGGEQDDEE